MICQYTEHSTHLVRLLHLGESQEYRGAEVLTMLDEGCLQTFVVPSALVRSAIGHESCDRSLQRLVVFEVLHEGELRN